MLAAQPAAKSPGEVETTRVAFFHPASRLLSISVSECRGNPLGTVWRPLMLAAKQSLNPLTFSLTSQFHEEGVGLRVRGWKPGESIVGKQSGLSLYGKAERGPKPIERIHGRNRDREIDQILGPECRSRCRICFIRCVRVT